MVIWFRLVLDTKFSIHSGSVNLIRMIVDILTRGLNFEPLKEYSKLSELAQYMYMPMLLLDSHLPSDSFQSLVVLLFPHLTTVICTCHYLRVAISIRNSVVKRIQCTGVVLESPRTPSLKQLKISWVIFPSHLVPHYSKQGFVLFNDDGLSRHC